MKYETTTVKVVRGREANKIAEMQSDGWDLVSQSEGISLRRELVFRREKKPMSTGDKRLSMVIGAFFAVVIVGGFGIAAIAGGDDDTKPSAETTQAEDTTSPEGSEEPSEPSEEPTTAESTEAPTEPEEPEEDLDEPITAQNSPEFAALLKGDYCDAAIGEFADKNVGRTVVFDGSIVNMAPHGSYDTRYDITFGPGNKGPMTTLGPVFKFSDVNVFDLNLTGEVPDFVREGQKYKFTVEVEEYNADTCLFFMRPIETKSR